MNENATELLRGTVETLQESELKERLDSGKQLVVKAGFDPTAADLHLGHVVLLNKLRAFQDAGHLVKFVIGDFTGMIGDPSGRDATRLPVSKEQLAKNALTYTKQCFKILDQSATQILFNSSWLEKLSLSELLHISSQYTVARMLERDDFHKRYIAQQSIGVHEFIYPLMQGYDSIVLSCDVELGGSDQKFNLLVGRHLQKAWGQDPQIVMMLPLLVGLDGHRKMSKSLNNYVGIDEEPQSMFGKIMSLSDELMWDYFELLSCLSSAEIEQLKASVKEGKNPRDIKMDLACELISQFHTKTEAQKSKMDFIARFRHNQIPDDIKEIDLHIKEDALPVYKILQMSSLTSSSSEARRMIEQGAVKINGENVGDVNCVVKVNSTNVYQVGKRKFIKIKLSNE